MAKSISRTGNISTTYGAGTFYSSISPCNPSTGGSTETNAETINRTSGIYSNLGCHITTNSRGASTYNFRVNGATVNQTLSVGASTTGDFVDTVNTDIISSGDKVDVMITIGAGGVNYVMTWVGCCFKNNSANDTITTGGNMQIASTGTTTRYLSFNTNSLAISSETEARILNKRKATLKNLWATVTANTWNRDVTIRSRKNGANGNMSVLITTLTTGDFEDTVNIDSLVNGDYFCLQFVPGAGAGSLTFRCGSSYLASKSNASILCLSGSAFISKATTSYAPINGNNTWSTTEALSQGLVYSNGKLKNLRLYISANTLTATSTFAVMNGGVAGSLSVSVGSGATGLFEDTTNMDVIVSGNSLYYRCTAGATGTSIGTRSLSLDFLQGANVSLDYPKLLLLNVG